MGGGIIKAEKKECYEPAELQSIKLKKRDISDVYRAAALRQIEMGRHIPNHEAFSHMVKYLKRSGYFTNNSK
jgi:hypothetical protein